MHICFRKNSQVFFPKLSEHVAVNEVIVLKKRFHKIKQRQNHSVLLSENEKTKQNKNKAHKICFFF